MYVPTPCSARRGSRSATHRRGPRSGSRAGHCRRWDSVFRPPLHWCSPLAPGRAPATGPGPPVGSDTPGHQTLAPRRAEPRRAESSRAAPSRAGKRHVPPAERSLLHTGDRPWGRSRVCSCQAGVVCSACEDAVMEIAAVGHMRRSRGVSDRGTRRPMNRAVPRNG